MYKHIPCGVPGHPHPQREALSIEEPLCRAKCEGPESENKTKDCQRDLGNILRVIVLPLQHA